MLGGGFVSRLGVDCMPLSSFVAAIDAKPEDADEGTRGTVLGFRCSSLLARMADTAGMDERVAEAWISCPGELGLDDVFS